MGAGADAVAVAGCVTCTDIGALLAYMLKEGREVMGMCAAAGAIELLGGRFGGVGPAAPGAAAIGPAATEPEEGTGTELTGAAVGATHVAAGACNAAGVGIAVENGTAAALGAAATAAAVVGAVLPTTPFG